MTKDSTEFSDPSPSGNECAESRCHDRPQRLVQKPQWWQDYEALKKKKKQGGVSDQKPTEDFKKSSRMRDVTYSGNIASHIEHVATHFHSCSRCVCTIAVLMPYDVAY